MYAWLNNVLKRYFKESTIFKYGFNISPMYRRTTGRILFVSDNLLTVKVKIPIGPKNKNIVGSIFGGSLFSATDPIFMTQLIFTLGNKYVVWDKKSTIKFKRPAFSDAFVDFVFTPDEIEKIKERVIKEKEIDVIKEIKITNEKASEVFTEVLKTIYVADKEYYKKKRGQQ
ncbi:PaaI family thioesterase [Tenacibaculum sp. C7A-26P2]|uniref:PaaI family thioesterase n=1 Tax=Tenacibaculum sp. C7A-26P2 TaxID=3447504 RepID=UPI003F8612C8